MAIGALSQSPLCLNQEEEPIGPEFELPENSITPAEKLRIESHAGGCLFHRVRPFLAALERIGVVSKENAFIGSFVNTPGSFNDIDITIELVKHVAQIIQGQFRMVEVDIDHDLGNVIGQIALIYFQSKKNYIKNGAPFSNFRIQNYSQETQAEIDISLIYRRRVKKIWPNCSSTKDAQRIVFTFQDYDLHCSRTLSQFVTYCSLNRAKELTSRCEFTVEPCHASDVRDGFLMYERERQNGFSFVHPTMTYPDLVAITLPQLIERYQGSPDSLQHRLQEFIEKHWDDDQKKLSFLQGMQSSCVHYLDSLDQGEKVKYEVLLSSVARLIEDIQSHIEVKPAPVLMSNSFTQQPNESEKEILDALLQSLRQWNLEAENFLQNAEWLKALVSLKCIENGLNKGGLPSRYKKKIQSEFHLKMDRLSQGVSQQLCCLMQKTRGVDRNELLQLFENYQMLDGPDLQIASYESMIMGNSCASNWPTTFWLSLKIFEHFVKTQKSTKEITTQIEKRVASLEKITLYIEKSDSYSVKIKTYIREVFTELTANNNKQLWNYYKNRGKGVEVHLSAIKKHIIIENKEKAAPPVIDQEVDHFFKGRELVNEYESLVVIAQKHMALGQFKDAQTYIRQALGIVVTDHSFAILCVISKHLKDMNELYEVYTLLRCEKKIPLPFFINPDIYGYLAEMYQSFFVKQKQVSHVLNALLHCVVEYHMLQGVEIEAQKNSKRVEEKEEHPLIKTSAHKKFSIALYIKMYAQSELEVHKIQHEHPELVPMLREIKNTFGSPSALRAVEALDSYLLSKF